MEYGHPDAVFGQRPDAQRDHCLISNREGLGSSL